MPLHLEQLSQEPCPLTPLLSGDPGMLLPQSPRPSYPWIERRSTAMAASAIMSETRAPGMSTPRMRSASRIGKSFRAIKPLMLDGKVRIESGRVFLRKSTVCPLVGAPPTDQRRGS